MKKAIKKFLLMGKIIILALLAVQFVYAVWWVIHNIGVVPDFTIVSESFLYERMSTFIGKGVTLVYLLQAVAMFIGIRKLMPTNKWVAFFAITNPLILQFIFALTPDAFCVSILLVLLGSVMQKEEIKPKHAIYLVLLGILNARYFMAGILVLLVIALSQYFRTRKNTETIEKTSKQKLSGVLAMVQVLLVVVLILVSYQTQKNVEDYTSVQQGIKERFTVDENIPSNHSPASVAKGLAEDSISYAMTPFVYLYVIDEKKLTQNSWNYINFTREDPRMSKYYMELSLQNIVFALGIAVICGLMVFALSKKNIKEQGSFLVFLLTCIGLCLLFTATTKRGMDYRNGLFMIPIWYYIILSIFEDVHIFSPKEAIEKL